MLLFIEGFLFSIAGVLWASLFLLVVKAVNYIERLSPRNKFPR